MCLESWLQLQTTQLMQRAPGRRVKNVRAGKIDALCRADMVIQMWVGQMFHVVVVVCLLFYKKLHFLQ